MGADLYQVVTTTDSQDEADTLASAIVQNRLGACVHVIPMTSVYRWQDQIRQDAELRLVVKTAADRLEPLINYINAHHSYDVPQIVATEIATGTDEYLSWINTETRT